MPLKSPRDVFTTLVLNSIMNDVGFPKSIKFSAPRD